MSKFRVLASVLILAVASVFMIEHGPRTTRAQFGTQPPGYFSTASNAVVNAAIGSAGAVTNPASNFVLLVQGGPVYCPTSSEQMIPQSTFTLNASATYLVVYNCLSMQLYTKTAVTAPGTPSPNQSGVPATLLFPIPGQEIALATVVCNATACGNGGNGSITDARPVAFFPGSGTPLNTTLFANLPTTNVTNGTIIFCADCAVATAPCTGASTGALAIRVNTTWRCQ